MYGKSHNVASTMIKISQKKRKLLSYFVPITIFCFAVLTSRIFGFKEVNIPWGNYQILDRQALIDQPFNSLYLLHSQPPILNGLLSLILKVSGIVSCSPETIIYAIFLLFGLLGAILLFHIIVLLTDSLFFATFGLILSLSDPAYFHFQHHYFYPFLLHFFFLILLSVFLKILQTRDNLSYLSIYSLLLGLIVNSRSLFHPIWAIVDFLLILAMLCLIHREKKPLYWSKVLGITLLLGLVLTAWPLKNLILFDQYTYSTWTGYNLAHDTSIRSDVLHAYIFNGKVPESLNQELAEFQKKNRIANIDVIKNSEKSNGDRNWNHYIFTKVNNELTREALQAKISNPLEWLKTSLSNYMKWSRGSYIHHISSRILGPDNPIYNLYSKFHRTIFFYNFRPLLERILPKLEGHWRFSMSGHPVPFTFFGIFIFPWIISISIFSSICMIRRKQYFDLAIIAFLLFTVSWVLIVPCLIDGSEGNRMRYSITPYLIILAIMALRATYGFMVKLYSKRVRHHL